MMLDDDLLARLQVRVVGDLVEAQRRAHRDVVVDRDLHPLGQRLRVEDPLDLPPQGVLAAAEVDDEIGAVLADEIVAARPPCTSAPRTSASIAQNRMNLPSFVS